MHNLYTCFYYNYFNQLTYRLFLFSKSQTSLVYLEGSEYSVVELGVLADPGVAVVDVRGHDVLVHHLRHHNKPLGQEVRLQAHNTPLNIEGLVLNNCYLLYKIR